MTHATIPFPDKGNGHNGPIVGYFAIIPPVSYILRFMHYAVGSYVGLDVYVGLD